MQKASYDLTNKRFGRLLVVEKASSTNGRSRWLCICDCGKEKTVMGQNLRNGHVRSCGCLLSKSSKERMGSYNAVLGRELHGDTKTRLYSIYIGIKTRCYQPKHHSYEAYGARGIRMCDEWLDSYVAFKDWSLSNGYNDRLTIDRIDSDGDYEPANCRWVNYSVQNFNKNPSSRNTSGRRGVSLNKRTKKFVAYISLNGKHRFLGSFHTFDEACTARKQAEKEMAPQQSPIS